MTGFVRFLLVGLVLAFAQPAFPQSSTIALQDGLCSDDCGSTGGPVDTPPAVALDASFVSQTVPTSMAAGKVYAVSVTMKNTGGETWYPGSMIRLGSQDPQDSTYWGTGRVEPSTVAGTTQDMTFSFTVRAPAVSGNYNFQWQMVKDGVAWFGPKTPSVVVVVKTTNLLPTVTLTSPTTGTTLNAPGAVTLSAEASDVGGSIASVSFWSNAELLGTDTSAPYSWSLSSLPAGTYQLRAVATDNEGAVASSSAAKVTVAGGTGVSATRRYVYDGYERLCKTVNPESGATIVDYDAAGNVTWSAEGLALTSGACDRESVASSAKVVRSYDGMNRLKSVTTPGGTADLQQDYYADGLVKSLSAMNPGKNKVTTTYAYNHRRLLTSESSSNGSTLFGLAYAYDANGSLSSLTYPDNHTVSFWPDALGRATRVSGSGPGDPVYARDIKYTASGAIAEFFYGNGIKHVREGNERLLPARSVDSYLSSTREDKVIDDRYTYDPNGNVTDITDAAQNGLTTRGMAYDGLDRLKAAVSPLQWGNAVYGYDALDNLRVADQGSRQYRYNYDAANRLANIKNPAGATLITLAYDARGNTTSKNSQVFVFDAVNRMNQVTGQQVYRYDGQGRRVQTTDADGKTTFWIYSQSGQVLYTSEARRGQNLAYIYLGNSQVATRSVAWTFGTVAIRYQHTDALGSPVAETDPLRNIVKRNSYAPYGEAFGSTVIDGTGYTGHVMDRATGLTYMQQRYYDPQIARVISVDPMAVDATAAWNFNRYEYANNNPYKFTDPDGRQAADRFGDQFKKDMESGNGKVYEPFQKPVLAVTTALVAATPVVGVYLAVAIRNAPALRNPGTAGGARAGKPMTAAGRREVIAGNRAANSGKTKCEGCDTPTTPSQQSRAGVPTPANETRVDHIIPQSKGGDGSPSNGQVLCSSCNIEKADRLDWVPPKYR